MVPSDSTVKTAKDLAGKRVVFATGSASASLMDAFFHKSGLTRDQMTLIGVDSSALPAAYISGKADAAITTFAYFGPIISTKRPSRAISYSSAGIRVPSFGLVISEDEEKTKSDALARFVPVTVRAMQYIIAGHVDEAIDAIIAQRPNDRLDRNVMTEQLKEYLLLVDTPNTKNQVIGWQSSADWKAALGDLKTAGLVQKDLDPNDLYTNRFLPKK
jgi:NitT/TauT family transport system substrate-binding protein